MRRRGSVLMQLLFGTVLLGIAMAALLQGTISLWRMQSFGTAMPSVQDDARGVAMRMADAFRGATLCTTSDSGCTVDAAVESVGGSEATVYRRNDDGTLSELQYYVLNGNFTLATGGSTTILCTDATLTLTYYASSSYYSNGLVAYTPTSANTASLAAVGIVSTVTRNGLTARFETFVRLRNSPKPT